MIYAIVQHLNTSLNGMTFFVVTFLPQTGMPSDATEVKKFFYGFLGHVTAQSGIKKMQ